MNAIETKGLTKSYAGVTAVRGLDLAVPAGSICGFLGRNGAGKTTTIKMLLGIARPTSGEGRVLDLDIADPKQSEAIRQRTGFVAEDKSLLPFLTVGETIGFVRPFYPAWRGDLERKYLDAFELPLDRKVAKLSKGTRTKLALLVAMARGCELLILDEPTEGLDPAAIEETLRVVVDLAAETGVTVFFSSHQLPEVEQIADRVVILDRGQAVLNESLDDLKTNYRRLDIVLADGRARAEFTGGDIEAAVAKARAAGARDVEVRPVSLKEIFLDATKTKGEKQ